MELNLNNLRKCSKEEFLSHIININSKEDISCNDIGCFDRPECLNYLKTYRTYDCLVGVELREKGLFKRTLYYISKEKEIKVKQTELEDGPKFSITNLTSYPIVMENEGDNFYIKEKENGKS